MKFKGTIIITDPGYIINDYSDQRPKFNTWPGLEEVTHSTQFKDFTEEQRKAYNEFDKALTKFYNEHDDWNKCDYGKNMESLGINHYITENTIYGDWSCTTYEIENPKEAVDKLAEIAKYFDDKYEEYGGYKGISEEQYESLCEECDSRQYDLNLDAKNIGHFCADAGLVSVFLLDEVLEYNPNFSKWMDDRPWCVTMIRDFDGDVEYYVDIAGNAHIIGTGSTNFFTTQRGF